MKRVVEPVRRSLLDVVQANLRAAGRTTYITRISYIGEYSGTSEDLEKKMKNIVDSLQTEYTDVFVSGLLLIYPQYYVHVLETSEEIIYKHFKIIHHDKCEQNLFGRAIFLPTYHHVNQTFFKEWNCAYTVPPTLLEKLDTHTLVEIQKQMSSCLTKVYTLCEYLSNATRTNSASMRNILENLKEKAAKYLPESTVLEFLLNAKTPVLTTIEDYILMHTNVPFMNLYNERVWPPPSDLTLRNVLDNTHRRAGRYSNSEQERRGPQNWYQGGRNT